MKRFLVVLAAVPMVAAPLLASGCSDSETTTGEGDRVSTILGLMGDTTAGATGFSGSCGLGSTCHNADGTSSGTAADLTETTAMLTDEVIVGTILNGEGSMPPQNTLDDQKIADILAYMRAEWGG